MNASRLLSEAEASAVWQPGARRARRHAVRATLAALLGMVAPAMVGPAMAQPTAAAQAGPAPSSDRELRLRGSRSQHALSVRLGPDHVLARSCPRSDGCDPEGGDRIAIDSGALEHRASATLERIALGPDRELALVTVSTPNGRWVLLVGASLASEPAAVRRPLVGWIDQPRGDPGSQRVAVLTRAPGPKGEQLGTASRHEAWLCGRPATIRARALDPASLDWRPTTVDNLAAAERAAAPTVTAARSAEPWPSAMPRLLRATAAGSGVGEAPTALTDGDLGTAWSEQLVGAGSNEVVVMSAAQAVPITGFDLVLQPTRAREVASPALPSAPRRLWLAAAEKLVRVELPPDAWSAGPGATFRIDLPEPWRTSCVALELDEAATSGGEPAVTIAEIRARTELDPRGPAGIVRALDEEGPSAPVASALLARGGPEVFDAMKQAWPKLGIAGRRHAVDILAALPCAEGAPWLVTRLHDEADDAESDRLLETVRARLRGCGVDGATALATRLRSGPLDRGQLRIAEELSLVAPAAAVSAILARLHEAPDDMRASLRASLATAIGMRRARPAVALHLEPARFAALPLVTRIDLLRALGARAAATPAAGAALGQVLGSDRSFRTVYLLLPVAGHLARAGDRAAETLLRSELTGSKSPWLRAQAALAAAGHEGLSSALGAALGDDHPRVRQAALEALRVTNGAPSRHASTLAQLLATDPWTFVRSATAAALGAAASSEPTEEALVDALGDPSPLVRQEVVRSLGQHGTEQGRAALRTAAGRAKEPVSVRVAAIKALGQLCDVESADLLTKLAHRVAQPQLAYDRPLGLAALRALGVMHPADLDDRLAPLLHPSVPEHVRQLAQNALREPTACPGPAH